METLELIVKFLKERDDLEQLLLVTPICSRGPVEADLRRVMRTVVRLMGIVDWIENERRT